MPARPPAPLTLQRLAAARTTAARVVQLHGPDPYLVHFERLDAEISERRQREDRMARVAEIAAQGE